MTIERFVGRKEISERLARSAEETAPLSRHLFPDSSFMLFGPSDCGGMKSRTTQKS